MLYKDINDYIFKDGLNTEIYVIQREKEVSETMVNDEKFEIKETLINPNDILNTNSDHKHNSKCIKIENSN